MAEQKDLYRAHLSIAIFCEKVLQEADSVMSVIRVIDRFNVVGQTPDMKPSLLNFTILISFKAGFMRGKQSVAIRPRSPQGKDLPSLEFPVLFEGDDERGIAVIAPTSLIVDEEGLYWFDVYLNVELITRMPLRIVYQQTQLPRSGG